MDLARLKAHYGEKITFVGNMDVRFLLTQGTAEQVRRATFDCIEQGAATASGGHILMSSNCIHKDVKPELFLASSCRWFQAHATRNSSRTTARSWAMELRGLLLACGYKHSVERYPS